MDSHALAHLDMLDPFVTSDWTGVSLILALLEIARIHWKVDLLVLVQRIVRGFDAKLFQILAGILDHSL